MITRIQSCVPGFLEGSMSWSENVGVFLLPRYITEILLKVALNTNIRVINLMFCFCLFVLFVLYLFVVFFYFFWQ